MLYLLTLNAREEHIKTGLSWWLMLEWPNKTFARHFRMTRDGFDYLMTELWTADDRERHADCDVTLERKTLMFLWYIANQNSFREVADKFNVTKSKCHTCVMEVLDKVCSMAPKYIQWPSQQAMAVSSEVFRGRARLERVIGAIDGCHIRIQRPPHPSASSYRNRKDYYSILLQGICNERGKFIDVFVGLPGCVHDARMLRMSDFFEHWNERMQHHTLLGDSAYISRVYEPFIRTPLRDNGRLTVTEQDRNSALSSGRVIIENAFGRLKCKFRRLRDLQNSRLDVCVKLILAACTLYNFCIVSDSDAQCEDHADGTCPRDDDENDDFDSTE